MLVGGLAGGPAAEVPTGVLLRAMVIEVEKLKMVRQ